MSSLQVQQHCSELIRQMQLPDSFQEIVSNIYLPLSRIIIQQKKDQPLLVSINGAQGTGKSTMTRFIKHIIESEMHCHVAELSLDDFYSVREKRMSLADDVHPLLATRGVPGTHDIDLIEQVFDSLLNKKACKIPRFNKALDDRDEESTWTHCDKPVDVILFEGWCNSSPPQSMQQLEQPINELEEKEDPHGIWRQYVNEQLIDYKKRIFNQADMCVMLKAPDFERIYQWRSLQEQKLALNTAHLEQNQVMNEVELKRFIQHYERISRHTIENLPSMADVVLPMKGDHSIAGIVEKGR